MTGVQTCALPISSRLFEEISIANPSLLLPLQGLAWIDLEKRTYAPATEKLARLISKVPKPKKPNEPYAQEALQIFEWTGRLREFVALGVSENLRPPESSLAKLDAAVEAHTSEAGRLYREGRTRTQQVIADFDQRIATGDDATKSRLRVERRQSTRYASFPYEEATQRILAGLDQAGLDQ